MSEYYCHKCATSKGFFRNYYSSAPVGSSYQLEKFIKHTTPDPTYQINSVFNNSSTEIYQKYIVSASCSGSVEIDDYGRKNTIWVAGKEIGVLHINGNPVLPQDAVKVVLSTDPNKIHGYSVNSTDFHTKTCIECGELTIV